MHGNDKQSEFSPNRIHWALFVFTSNATDHGAVTVDCALRMRHRSGLHRIVGYVQDARLEVHAKLFPIRSRFGLKAEIGLVNSEARSIVIEHSVARAA